MPPARALLLSTMLIASTSPAAVAASSAVDPGSIEVFISAGMITVGSKASASIYEIDGLTALDRELSESLSADPSEAKKQVLERINGLGDALRSRAERATEGLTLAQRYGIKKIPAVVFDGGASVVYGLLDLDQAIEVYSQAARP